MNYSNETRIAMKPVALGALLALLLLPGISDNGAAQEQKKTPFAPAPAGRIKDVDVPEFAGLVGDPKCTVLDVRTPREYAGGHLAGAVNLNLRAPDFATQAGKLDKSRTYLVYCAVGARSANACQKLAALGFNSLVNLKTGIQGWEGAGQPVQR